MSRTGMVNPGRTSAPSRVSFSPRISSESGVSMMTSASGKKQYKLVGLLGKRAENWREVFKVVGVKGDLEAVADRSDQTVHHADTMTQFIQHLRLHCPILVRLD